MLPGTAPPSTAKREKRARVFGAIFAWKLSVAGFSMDTPAPPDAAARGRCCSS
jgi:hypothetical protein